MFRDETVSDLYPYLFRTDPDSLDLWREASSRLGFSPRLDHHGVYSLYPFATITLLMNAYFRPSSEIKAIIKLMEQKYGLTNAPYAALYYRGTDKHTEVTLPNFEALITATRRKMQDKNLTRCLIQTDDAHFLKVGLDSLPGAFFLNELPVTNSDLGFHYQNVDEKVIEPLLFAQRLLAMTHVIANAATVTLPVSNLAGWVCLIRGNSDGVTQFNKHGNLITRLYTSSFKLKNKLRKTRALVSKAPYYYV